MQQGTLIYITVNAMTNEFEGKLDRIGTKLIKLISHEISKGTYDISTLAQELFPASDQIIEFLGMREGDHRYRTEFLPRLIDFLESIYNIENIEGINKNDLEFLKNNLLDLSFSIFFKKGLTIDTLKTLDAPNYIIDLAESYKMHLNYYKVFETQFEMLANTFNDKEYPELFRKNKRARSLQRTLLWQLSGGRDFLTGEKFTEIFKRQNPQFASLPEKHLIRIVKEMTTRHHYKTGGVYNKYDCRLSQIVLLMDYIEDQIHDEIRLNSKKGLEYELMFKRAIESLLKGEPPQHWDLKYQEEFLSENPNGINTFGIKYFLY